jgi:hypothetical protein
LRVDKLAETLNVYGAPGSSDATTIKNYFAEGAEEQLEIGFDRTGTKRIITIAGQDGAAYQRFLYITPDGKNFTFADYNQIIREVKKDAGGNIEALRTGLYRKGYLTEKDYNTKSDAAFTTISPGALATSFNKCNV